MSPNVATLYGANIAVLAAATAGAEVEDVGRLGLALEVLGGVDLVRAGGVGLGAELTLIAVLGARTP